MWGCSVVEGNSVVWVMLRGGARCSVLDGARNVVGGVGTERKRDGAGWLLVVFRARL